MKRRLFYVFGAASLMAVACLAWGFFIEPHRLTVRAVTVEADVQVPLRIAVISDLHAGGNTTFADDIRAAIEKSEPDLVLIAGDFIVGSEPASERSEEENAAIGDALAPLRGLTAPRGVFAVMGNHDHWYGTREAEALIDTTAVQRIDNRIVEDDDICVVGLGDEWEGHPDLSVVGACPAGKTRIVLTHNPDTILRVKHGFHLAVAGHTHGGQINLPIVGRAVTATEAGKPYAYGLKQAPGGPLYITSGVGTSILPARFRAPPEVVIIDLRAANED